MAGLVALVLRGVRTRLSPPPPEPSVPAIEELAAALRRVRPLVLAPAPGTPMARRRGTTAAYDDLLGQAARALRVPDLLTDLREGTDRDAERLRLGHAAVALRDELAVARDIDAQVRVRVDGLERTGELDRER